MRRKRKLAQALPNRPLNAWEGEKWFGSSTRRSTKPKVTPIKKKPMRPKRRKPTTPPKRYYA